VAAVAVHSPEWWATLAAIEAEEDARLAKVLVICNGCFDADWRRPSGSIKWIGQVSDAWSAARKAATCQPVHDLVLENLLGYGREFLPARGLIARNAHIGKPRVSRGLLGPHAAFGLSFGRCRVAAFSA
jgi:hypothetical protein